MQMAQADAALSDTQKILLQQAEAARVASEGNPYTFGGQTIEGFDCSGFVIYVFNQAYGSNTLLRVTAEDLRTEGRFAAVASPGAPCDLIFFSSSAGSSTAAHVGIVVDSTRWIGSQSSTGVAYVSLSNVYWRPRILSYGRYQPLRVAQSIIPSRAGSFASIINPTA